MSRLQDITTFTDTEIDNLDYFWVNEIGTSTATLSIASPCVVSKTAHGLEVGNKISFTTSGALPTGISASTDYYIISTGFGLNSFQISATYNGTAISTSGTQSGTHTYVAYVSKKMSGEKLKTLVVPSTPSSEVSFDKLTPTTVGVVFDPNTPSTTDILYYSTVDGSTWIYNGTTYISKTIPNSTEFVLESSFVDAGSNKTADISRNGSVKVRNDNTTLARFTQILSFGIAIVSDLYAQITQTAVSNTVYPLTRMTRKRGTITSQTVALSGDILGQYLFSGGNQDGAKITAIATQDHTTFSGTKIIISNIPNGSNTPVNSVIINESNGVDFVGTVTAPYLIGQIDARVQSVTSSATVTPTSTNDLVKMTAQAVGLTLANPTGTFTEGQALMIRIKDNGTAQTIAFDTNYRAIGVTLPTTTVISKTIYLGIIYNSNDAKWDVIGYNLQA